MKIEIKDELKSSTSATVTITIDYDPSNERQEGYAALVATVVDTVKRTVALEQVIDALNS